VFASASAGAIIPTMPLDLTDAEHRALAITIPYLHHR
jgi:hypothetical protein